MNYFIHIWIFVVSIFAPVIVTDMPQPVVAAIVAPAPDLGVLTNPPASSPETVVVVKGVQPSASSGGSASTSIMEAALVPPLQPPQPPTYTPQPVNVYITLPPMETSQPQIPAPASAPTAPPPAPVISDLIVERIATTTVHVKLTTDKSSEVTFNVGEQPDSCNGLDGSSSGTNHEYTVELGPGLYYYDIIALADGVITHATGKIPRNVTPQN